MAKKSLIKLAKGNKKPVIKEINKPKTAAEERDLKAKEKVEELLKDVIIEPEKKEEKFFDANSNEWLEEQVTLLSEEVEKLRKKLTEIKEENEKLKIGFEPKDTNLVVKGVVDFFNDFQNNYIPGTDPMGRPNMLIWPVAFMNRMIEFMPFLKPYMKH